MVKWEMGDQRQKKKSDIINVTTVVQGLSTTNPFPFLPLNQNKVTL